MAPSPQLLPLRPQPLNFGCNPAGQLLEGKAPRLEHLLAEVAFGVLDVLLVVIVGEQPALHVGDLRQHDLQPGLRAPGMLMEYLQN